MTIYFIYLVYCLNMHFMRIEIFICFVPSLYPQHLEHHLAQGKYLIKNLTPQQGLPIPQLNLISPFTPPIVIYSLPS